MKKEYAEEVAGRIIEQLQQGTAPWQRPWQPGELRLPFNPTTGKEYKGMNTLWLHMQGHSDPRWMTYNQAADAGAQVRKGSKGTHIVYWKFTEDRKATDAQGKPVIDPETGRQKTITVQLERPRAFTAVVFNAEQIDGLPPLEARAVGPEPERIARAEAIMSNSGAKISHVAGNRAFYSPVHDAITMPERAQFDSADGYYATALHELGHWTGHADRLDRDLAHPFGSEGYAREELRAEIASLMLGERLEIGHDPGQHAAYVGSWIKALQDDPREIFRAAADAEKIAAYVMGFEQEQAKTVERQPAEQATDLASGKEREAITSQELPQAQGAPVPVAWRYEACRVFDEEMSARTGDPSYSKAQELAHALNEYEEMGFEPSPREQAILAERKPAMDEAAQWIHQNVLLNPVVKERVYETVRDLGRDTGDTATDKSRRDYLEEMAGKQRAQETQQEKQAYTVHSRRTVPENAANNAGQNAVYVELDDGRKAWGFGATNEAAEQTAVERAQRVGLDADRVPTRAVLHEQPEKAMESRVYLAVPYKEKEQAKAAAKAAGFRLAFDDTPEVKAWYAPAGADLTTLARWRTDAPHVVAPAPTRSAEAQFKEALLDAGLRIEGDPIMDGKIHRVPVAGDKGNETSGAYAGHLTGRIPGGFIQNFKTGERIDWKAEGKVGAVSPEERARLAAEAAQQREQREAETTAKHNSTAEAAYLLWTNSPAATADNAYCKLKGIENPYDLGLRQVPDQVPPALAEDFAAHGIKIAATAKEAKALREADPNNRVFKAGDLLVPGTDAEGGLWTLQSINPYFKSFMKGGRKHGLFTVLPGSSGSAEATAEAFALGKGGKPIPEEARGNITLMKAYGKGLQELDPATAPVERALLEADYRSALGDLLFSAPGLLGADPAAPLVIAEGYATAYSVAKATGKPVVVAFDSGNLDAVARELRELYPSRPMFIAADNDHNAPKQLGPDGKPRPNVGMEKAKEAAPKYGAGVIAPQFKDGEKGSDWNDCAANRGQDEMRKHLAEQMAAARVEASLAAERLVTVAREREMEARNDPTTSADDRAWAKEQRKSAEALSMATDRLGDVRSKTADGVLSDRKSTRAPAAVKAGIDRSTNAMKDRLREERQEVQNRAAETVADGEQAKKKGEASTSPKRPAKSRSRGADAGL